jgi:hypothetical protein
MFELLTLGLEWFLIVVQTALLEMKRVNRYTVHKQIVIGTVCDTVEYYGRVETECGKYWKISSMFSTYAAAEQWCKDNIKKNENE